MMKISLLDDRLWQYGFVDILTLAVEALYCCHGVKIPYAIPAAQGLIAN